ncbi:MAG: hypothetical protein KF912_00030 [Phycisphaeraceae bacterium]|nr:hypothetical protein [Phycisphaeraceae bacterium]MBX3365685.1 hypothetical protein [Phycisphaeraceae bacterium]
MPAPVVHCEIGVKDITEAKEFCGQRLGWEFQEYGPAAMVLFAVSAVVEGRGTGVRTI